MPRSSLDALVEAQLSEDEGDLLVEMRSDLVRESDGGVLYTAGGLWDRRTKSYTGRGERSRILRVHDGQVPAATWIAEWMRARKRGKRLYTPNGKPIYSAVLVGGRRIGKSDLGNDAAIHYALDFRGKDGGGSITWIVLPAFPDMPEVVVDIEKKMPATWFTWIGEPWYKWTLASGSEIHLKSSHDPDDLKRGRADFVVLHEAQKHHPRTYGILRPAIADEGGLVLMTMNPPDGGIGEWVAEHVENAEAGKIGSKIFHLKQGSNPHVDYAALESLKDELDERTYRREVLGEFLPREDVVMYAFSPTLNVEPTPPEHEEVTAEFLRKHLGGKDFRRVHGVDFQLVPHMAGATLRFFRDPEDPLGDPLAWYTDCVTVERGTEDELVDALEAKGFTGDDPVVPDASGEWQDAARTKGKASLDVFRRRGWKRIYLPVAGSTKNPPVMERVAIANGLFCSATGKRRLFVDPRCVELVRAFRLWENRNGAPNRRSDYAHIVDSATYPLCRLFPRRAPRTPLEYSRVERERSQRSRDLEVY